MLPKGIRLGFLWLGPAAIGLIIRATCPLNGEEWWDFGTGSFSDMAAQYYGNSFFSGL